MAEKMKCSFCEAEATHRCVILEGQKSCEMLACDACRKTGAHNHAQERVQFTWVQVGQNCRCCGKPAVRICMVGGSNPFGAFVCGQHLCKNCGCNCRHEDMNWG